jgi:hypothetical protein
MNNNNLDKMLMDLRTKDRSANVIFIGHLEVWKRVRTKTNGMNMMFANMSIYKECMEYEESLIINSLSN